MLQYGQYCKIIMDFCFRRCSLTGSSIVKIFYFGNIWKKMTINESNYGHSLKNDQKWNSVMLMTEMEQKWKYVCCYIMTSFSWNEIWHFTVNRSYYMVISLAMEYFVSAATLRYLSTSHFKPCNFLL